MKELAAKIRQELDNLTLAYTRRMAAIPAYIVMSEQARWFAASNALHVLIDTLVSKDFDALLGFMRSITRQRVQQEFDAGDVHQELNALGEVVGPLISTVEEAKFVWQAISKAHAELAQTALEPMRKSETEFRAMVDNVAVGVFVYQDETLLYAGREGIKMLGYESPDEVIRRSILDFVHPDDRERIADYARRRTAGAELPGQYEARLLKKDGGVLHVRMFNSVTQYCGAPAGLGTFVDITDSKRAEESLRENEARFRSIVENSHAGVFMVDNAYHFTYANQQLADILGYSINEILEMDFRQVLTQESLRQVADYYVRRQKGEELPSRYELSVRRKDGQVRHGELSSTVIRDAAGSVQTVAQFLDTTERKRAAQAVVNERNLLRTLIDSIPDPIFIKDANSRYQVANQALAAALGLDSPEQMVGKSDEDYYDPTRSAVFLADDRAVIQLGQPLINKDEPLETDGRKRWILTSKFPIQNEKGQVVGLVGVTRDISRRREAEQALEQSLARRGRQMQVSTEIAQEIAAAPDLELLFSRVVTLIKERLNYYHVQIFRHDTIDNAMVLVRGYGEVGQQMVAAGHRLEMGRGLVGKALDTGRPALSADVSQSPDWVPNPYLPQTRGELVVPIILRSRPGGSSEREEILGILDVQSDQVGVLGEEDQLLLEGLCGQIAIAIESTRLREGMQERLAELNALHRSVSRQGWQEVLGKTGGPGGYRYDRSQVLPAGDLWLPEMAQALKSSGLLVPDLDSGQRAAVAPLTLYGEAIGALGVYVEPGQPLSEDELILIRQVSEQLAVALDSARLFEETQSARADAETLYQVSTELNAAQNYDEILAAVTRFTILGQADQNASLNLFDRPWEEEEMPDWAIPIARQGAASPEATQPRYPMKAMEPVMRLLKRDQPTVISNVMTDPRLSEAARSTALQLLGGRAAIFVPLLVAGQWIGYLNATYRQPVDFPEAEVRRLTVLSQQAAVAVQSLRQLEEIEARAGREQALRQAAEVIGAAPNLAESMPLIAQNLRRLVPLDHLLVTTYRPGDPECVVLGASWASAGEHSQLAREGSSLQPGMPLGLKRSADGWVITQGEPWIEADMRRQLTFDEDRQWVEAGIVSRIVVPLRVGEGLIGTLNLGSTRPGTYTAEHLPLLMQVAGQLGLTLERSRLLEEARAALESAEASYQRYLGQQWEGFLTGGIHSLGYRASSNRLEPVEQLWAPEIHQAIAQGTLVEWKEPDHDGRPARTALALPLRLGGQTIGVLDFYSDEEREWSEHDRALVEALADQLALALDNARLIEQTERRAYREQLTTELAAKIHGAGEVHTILETAAGELGRVLGVSRAMIRLGTPDEQNSGPAYTEGQTR